MDSRALHHLGRKGARHQSDRVENYYDEITCENDDDPINEKKFVGSALFLMRKDTKSKILGLFGCFGKSKQTQYCYPGSTYLCISESIPKAVQTGSFLNKGVQTESQEQETTDQATQIPDVSLVCSSKSQCSQREGIISLSLPDSNIEDSLLETFLRNRDTVAKVLERHGLTLHSIEKGSIRFKFTIREAVSALSEDTMRHLLTNICRETLQSIPDRLRLEDVIIEVELSSLESTQYNIHANVVQLGNENKVEMSPPAHCDPTRPIMYINPIPSAEPTRIATEAEPESVLAEIQSGGQDIRKESSSGRPTPCKQTQDDSAYGSGCAQDQSHETRMKTVQQATASQPNTIVTEHESGADQYQDPIPVWAAAASEQSSNTLRKQSEVYLQSNHDAYILFKAQDKETMKLVMDELSALKFLSFLEFDLENDFTNYTVKMYIFKRCTTLKDFFTSVVQFPTYRHLLTAITTHMIEVTVVVPSAERQLSHYVNVMQHTRDASNSHQAPDHVNAIQHTHDASISFQAPDQAGMNAIMVELEPLKTISLLKFDLKSHSPTNNVTMVIQTSNISDETFIASVLQFPTYVHLLRAILDNEVDVKIQMSTRVYDTCSIQTNSDAGTAAEVMVPSDEYAESRKTKPKHKRSGLSGFFSSLRHSVRSRKEK